MAHNFYTARFQFYGTLFCSDNKHWYQGLIQSPLEAIRKTLVGHLLLCFFVVVVPEDDSWTCCFKERPHPCFSLSLKGYIRIEGREATKGALSVLNPGLKERGTQADLGAGQWWEAGFTNSAGLTQAGLCSFWPQQIMLRGTELQWLGLGQKLSSMGNFWHLVLLFRAKIC